MGARKRSDQPINFSTSDSAGFLSALQADVSGFERLSHFLKERCGIDLPTSPKNLSLMSSRLRKILEARSIANYQAYANLLDKGSASDMNEFISALTTNTTHFFREGEHFKHLTTAVSELMEQKTRDHSPREIRVWCAASSTGQEPYTILMTLLEAGLMQKGFTLKMIATDIDIAVLEKAANAVYRLEDAEGIPAALRSKYFEVKKDQAGASWARVRKEFAQMIRFARLNLTDTQWPFQQKFDFVFCRNVLIYFDAPTAQATIERMATLLPPGGLMYIGHSECGHVKTKLVKTVHPAVYKRLPKDV